MEELLDYIDRYFNGELQPEDREAFEKRCETDLAFAEAVSFYISARQGIKSELHEQKRTEFSELYRELSATRQEPTSIIRKLVPYMAAASILIFLGWLLFFNDASPQQLANKYVNNNLSTLPVTMGGLQDSIQQGIAAYNRKDYSTSESIFLSLASQSNPDPEVYKYLGLVYLQREQYDKAIVQFDKLVAYKDLYANPGLFYKAITLMKRSGGEDRQQAKEILQQIISKDLPGKKEAANWIRHF